MAVFALANFTGSAVALNAYTPDTGGAFTRNQGTNIPYIGQQTSPDIRNMLAPSGSGSQQSHWSQNSAAAATADYDVIAVMKYIAPGVSGQKWGIGGRGNAAGGTGYYFGWDEDAQLWRLGKLATFAGGVTSLATSAATLVDGQSYTIKLEMRSTAIKGYVDGVAVCSITDSSFTTGNRACVVDMGTGHQAVPGAGSGISGLFMDSLTGQDPVAAPTKTTDPAVAPTTGVHEGDTLTNTPGTYTGSPTVTRKWQKDTVDISGPAETGATYAVRAGDATHAIRCVETATNAGGSVTGTSNAVTIAATAAAADSLGLLGVG